jgi:hypothetical protein
MDVHPSLARGLPPFALAGAAAGLAAQERPASGGDRRSGNRPGGVESLDDLLDASLRHRHISTARRGFSLGLKAQGSVAD